MNRVGRPPEYSQWTEQQQEIWDRAHGHEEAWRNGDEYQESHRGDAWEGDPKPSRNGKAPHKEPSPRDYHFSPINSANFATADYAPQWIIPQILVKDQPGIAGGPRKALKTTILADLVISVGSGTPFLGKFRTCGKRRTAIISGESGPFTLQETMKRICVEKGIEPQDIDCLWDFRLPRLSDFLELMELRRGLEENRIELLVVDPIYLALLAGQKNGQEVNPADLFAMGPLFLAIAEACLSVGTTPLLIHHARKNRANPYEPLELEDLAFAGIQEFARQWLLIARREPYEPGTGEHRLWLTSGGSIGHGNLWALNINEGVINEDFSGRTWEVEVISPGDVRQNQTDEKQVKKDQAKQATLADDETRFLMALDSLSQNGQAVTVKKIRDYAGINNDKASGAKLRLKSAGIIEEHPVIVASGRGTKTVDGVRRKPNDIQEQTGLYRDDTSCPDSSAHGVPVPGQPSLIEGCPVPVCLGSDTGKEEVENQEIACPGNDMTSQGDESKENDQSPPPTDAGAMEPGQAEQQANKSEVPEHVETVEMPQEQVSQDITPKADETDTTAGCQG